jgi:chemotaxis signal transduction protein
VSGELSQGSWLCFRVASCEYALPLADVSEVSARRVRYLIPALSLEVGGIINLRGETLPALDAGLLLVGVLSRSDRQLLVIERERLRVGLCVDAVLRIVHELEEELVPLPPDADERPGGGLGSGCYTDRVTKRGSKLRVVDSAALLSRAVALMSDAGSGEGEARCHSGF